MLRKLKLSLIIFTLQVVCDKVLKGVTRGPTLPTGNLTGTCTLSLDLAPRATRTVASWSGPARRGTVSPTTSSRQVQSLGQWAQGDRPLFPPQQGSLTELSVMQQEEAREEETTNLGRRNGARQELTVTTTLVSSRSKLSRLVTLTFFLYVAHENLKKYIS